MWFPNELFTHIKDYMLDYKKYFSIRILPLIVYEYPFLIYGIRPTFKARNHDTNTSIFIYEIRYIVPRYSRSKTTEDKLNNIGLTFYGPDSDKRMEKRYLYLKNAADHNNLEGMDYKVIYDNQNE